MVHNERVFLGIQRKVHQKPWMIFHSFHGGTFGEKEKKRTFSTGTSIWTTNRVLPLFFNFLSPKQFGSTRLRCLVCSVPGGRKICSLDSLDSKCDQDFARQFQISKFVGATDSDSHNSAFLLWMCLFIEHSPSFQ